MPSTRTHPAKPIANAKCAGAGDARIGIKGENNIRAASAALIWEREVDPRCVRGCCPFGCGRRYTQQHTAGSRGRADGKIGRSQYNRLRANRCDEAKEQPEDNRPV